MTINTNDLRDRALQQQSQASANLEWAEKLLAAADDLDAARNALEIASIDLVEARLQTTNAQGQAAALQAQVNVLTDEVVDLTAEVQRLNDLLAPPPVVSYHLTASAPSVDEGASVIFTLTTQGVPAGTEVPYALSGVAPEDVDGSMSGVFLVDATGVATASVSLKADATTEGLESLTLTIPGDVGPVTVQVQDTSTTPVPPPVVVPPPLKPEGLRYLYEQPYLFQPQTVWPSRIPNGQPYTDGMHYGATARFVNGKAGWPWDKKGGDWRDLDGVRYGAKPWAVVDITTEGEHSTDVTALVRAPGWLALLARANSQRRFAGATSTMPPRIEVAYEDGEQSTLACWYASDVSGSSTVPTPLNQVVVMPAVLEFVRPTKAVASATLFLTSIGLFPASGGAPRIELFKLDPPINKDEPTTGLAGQFVLDAGITSHPAVFGAHLYADGTSYEQFVHTASVGNIDDERQFDPALYGTGPTDLTKLPHVGLGRWVNAGPDWSLVSSEYTGEGFKPLAPGLGAMCIRMAPANPVNIVTGKREGFTDGITTGYDGTGAAGAKIYLPADKFGLQRTMFVRCSVRLARGEGWVEGEAGRRQVYAAGSQAKWTDDAGKSMPMPIHNRTTGGFSGSAGGGMGWQARCSWAHNDAQRGGPSEGGWTLGAHLFDFQGQNPPGHSYANNTAELTQFGQRGGLGGMLYYDTWYDFEAEITLNSVDQPAVLADGTPHVKNGVRQYWTPDGAWRVWIDGRLAFERTGMVFRSLPVFNPGFRAGYSRPCRELGAEGLMLNWFHGGVTQNVRPRAMFLASLVWSSERIGPLRLR